MIRSFFTRCVISAGAITATCSVAHARTADDTIPSETSTSATTRYPLGWAKPSPYDEDIADHRFGDVEKHRRMQEVWDLRGLLQQWHASDEEETWPWVWCQRNASGPHHVFVNVGPDTLSQVRALAAADDIAGSGFHNVTVIAESRAAIEKHCSVQDLYDARCAIVEGQSPRQIDTTDKVMMLDDERIICFDRLVVA